jgi:hypothetical protein
MSYAAGRLEIDSRMRWEWGSEQGDVCCLGVGVGEYSSRVHVPQRLIQSRPHCSLTLLSPLVYTTLLYRINLPESHQLFHQKQRARSTPV